MNTKHCQLLRTHNKVHNYSAGSQLFSIHNYSEGMTCFENSDRACTAMARGSQGGVKSTIGKHGRCSDHGSYEEDENSGETEDTKQREAILAFLLGCDTFAVPYKIWKVAYLRVDRSRSG